MLTLTLYQQYVNASSTTELATVAPPLAALLGLLALAAAGRLLRQAFAAVWHLFETVLAIGLVAIVVLAVVFAAGYAIAVAR
jgi:hypothetical protein